MTPAFIVEGKAEQKIIQKICPGTRVVILECNGTHVKMSAVAKRVASLFRIFGNRHSPVNLIFDREKRDEECDVIEHTLIEEIQALDIDPKQFRFGIADRKLETWILYSVDKNGKFNPNCSSSQKNEFEGSSSSYELSARLKRAGIDYHKTTVAVEMFSKIDPRRLAEKSDSFKRYIDKIDFTCSWLKKLA